MEREGHELYRPLNLNLSNKSENDIKIFAFNPSWVWLAKNIAEGAVAWAAGKILEILFKKSGVDPVTLIRDVFRQELRGEALREATGLMESISTSLLEYNHSPNTSIDRLSWATNRSNELISELKSLNTLGFTTWLSAISLRICILQERDKLNPGSERPNINLLITNSLSYSEEMMTTFQNITKNAFSPLHCEIHSRGKPEFPFEELICNYSYKGKKYVCMAGDPANSDWRRCERGREEHIRAELGLVTKNIINPSKEIVSKWEQIIKNT